MISINGNNILSAYTGGIPVQAIYCEGTKVWPTSDMSLSYYYASWTDRTGGNVIRLSSKNFSYVSYERNNKGFFRWYNQQYITYSTFGDIVCDYFETNARTINPYAFAADFSAYTHSLVSVSLPGCIDLGECAFYSMVTLQSISLPECTGIWSHAFNGCTSLQSISLPKCKILGIYAFNNCKNLQSIDLPVCMSIGDSAFTYCSSLQSIDLPNCSYIGGNAFYLCSSLQSISLPLCSYIGNSAFYDCYSLQSISLPKCSYIGCSAFYYCKSLTIITLGYSSVCSLYTSGVRSVFNYLKSIYVPSSLVSAYKSASGWSAFSSQIFAIPS